MHWLLVKTSIWRSIVLLPACLVNEFERKPIVWMENVLLFKRGIVIRLKTEYIFMNWDILYLICIYQQINTQKILIFLYSKSFAWDNLQVSVCFIDELRYSNATVSKLCPIDFWIFTNSIMEVKKRTMMMMWRYFWCYLHKLSKQLSIKLPINIPINIIIISIETKITC